MFQARKAIVGSRHRLGAVAVKVAICLVALVSVVAIALDGGVLFDMRRQSQAAADAAALAAAVDLYQNYRTKGGLDPDGTAANSAKTTATAAGFPAADVTVNIPPLSGPFAGQAGFAEVIVDWYQSRSFSNIFASGPIHIQARAVARGQWTSFKSGIIILDPTADRALYCRSVGGLTVSGGASLIVDSNAKPNAAEIAESGNVSAPTINITGGYQVDESGRFVGTVTTGVQPTPDPLAYLPPPDPSSMPLRSSSTLNITTDTTLQPGIYRGGIVNSSNANITLMPGIYYMDGGGFTISGGGKTTGSEVMIYNAPSGTVSITGTGSLNITPPTSGIYTGMAIFQDRNSTAAVSLQSSGSATRSVIGTIYCAKALLAISGGGSLSGSQVVCGTMALDGAGSFAVNWNGNTARTRLLGLVE